MCGHHKQLPSFGDLLLEGFAGLEKSAGWDDLPRLSGVDLPRLTSIATRQVKEAK